METASAGDATAVSAAGQRKTAGNGETNAVAESAAESRRPKSPWEARATDNSACAWSGKSGQAGTSLDSASQARRSDDPACKTGDTTETHDASGGARSARYAEAHARVARISEPAERAAGAEAECVFGDRGWKAGERAR